MTIPGPRFKTIEDYEKFRRGDVSGAVFRYLPDGSLNPAYDDAADALPFEQKWIINPEWSKAQGRFLSADFTPVNVGPPPVKTL